MKVIKRERMPQIELGHYDEFMQHLSDYGVRMKMYKIDPKELKPRQKINDTIAKKLENAPTDKLNKAVLISKNKDIIDGHHRWKAHVNLGKKLNVIELNKDFEKILKIAYEFKWVKFKSSKTNHQVSKKNFSDLYEEMQSCTKIDQKQLNDLEKFGDRLLKKLNIDIEFTRHFGDRMNDKRNDPCIKVNEIQRFFKKILKNKGRNIKSNADIQAVLKDISNDLNIPVVIDYKEKEQEFEVRFKTIMRKKNFSTRNKVIEY